MRPTPLTTEQTAAVDALRARVSAAVAAAGLLRPRAADLARAPFITGWVERPYPGGDEICLAGVVHGHPVLGTDTVVTSPILHRGEGWAQTASGTVYLLGPPCRDARLARQTARSADANVAAAVTAASVAASGYRP